MGQPVTYFEILDDHDLQTERSSNPVLINDSVYWTTAGYDFSGMSGTHLSLLEISHEGEVLRESVKPESEGRYAVGHIVSYGDTGVLCLTSYDSLNEPTDRFNHVLTAFDKEGNLLWERTYVDSGFVDTPEELIKAQGGYLIIGQRYDDGGGDVVLMKVNDQGNFQWRKTYGGQNYESGNSVVETLTGDLFLLGWTRSFGSGNRDFYLVRTDSLGNEQWHEEYGDSNFDSGLTMERLEDGNLILAGYRNLNDKRQAYFYKVNQNGDVIWEQEYGDAQSTEEFRGVVELENGDIVGVGLFDENAPSGSNNQGLLIRTDNEGNLKWLRIYDKSEQTDFFYGVLPTDDGGFLLSGQAINEDNFTQDAWMLKVDSIGCPYPNCTVGIDEQGKIVLVDVWPNPCVDVLNIENVGSSNQLDLSVFDLNGKLVNSFTQNNHKETIDVSEWRSGVYVLQGTDEEGRSFSLKVVKR